MNPNMIFAIVRRDFHGLLPLVILAFAVFFVQPIVANLNLDGTNQFWLTVQTNFYWIAYFISILLLISVIQLDPAVSLNHDWLTRPITKADWVAAKLLFLLLTVYLPTVIARLIVNTGDGYDISTALGFALALENPTGLIPIPLIIAVALLTATLRKFVLVTIIVFMIFLGPAWDVSRPLFDLLGVDLGVDYDGMMWVQSIPMTLWGVLAAMAVFWFLYVRRHETTAWWSLNFALFLVFFTMYTPSPLYSWDEAIAVHRMMINDSDDSLDDVVTLEHSLACFPASTLDTTASNPVLAEAGLYEEIIEAAGPGAVLFATTIRSNIDIVDWFRSSVAFRELSVDWKVDRVRFRGYYTADSVDQEVDLIRANRSANRYEPTISPVDTNYWLIPGEFVDALTNDPTTQLHIDYDVTLFSPTVYELPTDGQRYEFPEVGSCRAIKSSDTDSIDIDCVKSGLQPAIASAELVGIEGSRVYNFFRPNYKADWLDVLSRKRHEITIDNAGLADSSVVMLTAYNPERIMHKEVVSQGLFGNDPAICPAPNTEEYNVIERSSWSDRSPHEISSVAVERGVRVEVLDWRNGETKDAPTLFLLPGLGGTAHSFDEIAPKLAEKYNVIGMTRRGVGASGKPNSGYGVARLSQDVLQVLDTFNIASPILVGHSIAGEELSYLGANFPDRFSGLVYLDAAYNRMKPADRELHALNTQLPEVPPPRPSEFVSYEAAGDYAKRTGRSRNIPEGEILASYNFATGGSNHNSLYLDAVLVGMEEHDYTEIRVPALAIYAVPSSPDTLMEAWYDQDDPKVQDTIFRLFEKERQRKHRDIEQFDSEVPDSKVIILDDADHWIFLSHEREVLDEIDRFVSSLPQ